MHSQISIAAILSIDRFIPYILLLHFNLLIAAFPIIYCCIPKHFLLISPGSKVVFFKKKFDFNDLEQNNKE